MHYLYTKGISHSFCERRFIFFTQEQPGQPTQESLNQRDILMKEMLALPNNKQALKQTLLELISNNEDLRSVDDAAKAVRARILQLQSVNEITYGNLNKIMNSIPSDTESFINFAIANELFTPTELLLARTRATGALEQSSTSATNAWSCSHDKNKILEPSPSSSATRKRSTYFDTKRSVMVYADGTEKTVTEIRQELASKDQMIRQARVEERVQSIQRGQVIRDWRRRPVEFERTLKTNETAARNGMPIVQRQGKVSVYNNALDAAQDRAKERSSDAMLRKINTSKNGSINKNQKTQFLEIYERWNLKGINQLSDLVFQFDQEKNLRLWRRENHNTWKYVCLLANSVNQQVTEYIVPSKLIMPQVPKSTPEQGSGQPPIAPLVSSDLNIRHILPSQSPTPLINIPIPQNKQARTVEYNPPSVVTPVISTPEAPKNTPETPDWFKPLYAKEENKNAIKEGVVVNKGDPWPSIPTTFKNGIYTIPIANSPTGEREPHISFVNNSGWHPPSGIFDLRHLDDVQQKIMIARINNPYSNAEATRQLRRYHSRK